jgi:membrane protein
MPKVGSSIRDRESLNAQPRGALHRGENAKPDLWVALLGAMALGAAGYLTGRPTRRAPAPDVTPHDTRSVQEREAESSDPHPQTGFRQTSGQRAYAPQQIPSPGWRNIAFRVKDAITRDRVLIVAGGVTFYAILSLFPLIAAFVALYGLFADPSDVARLVDDLEGTVPQEVLGVVEEQLDRLVSADTGALTLTSLIALAVAFWSANGGIKGLMEAMNVAYNEREERSFLKLNLTAMSMTLSGMALVATMIALSAVVPAIVALFPGAGWRDALLLWGRWPLMAVLLIMALAILYRLGPDRRAAKWRWITPGAVAAAVGMIAVSAAFSFYTSNFAAYDETYGSFGAIIAVMMWFWLTSIVVIVGAEINAETEHQTARDSTIGPDRPMGERDARMADTVAPPLSRS